MQAKISTASGEELYEVFECPVCKVAQDVTDGDFLLDGVKLN